MFIKVFEGFFYKFHPSSRQNLVALTFPLLESSILQRSKKKD